MKIAIDTNFCTKINTRDVMYNMIDIINTATQTHTHIYIKVVKRMNPESSHHKEKMLFVSFSWIMDVH